MLESLQEKHGVLLPTGPHVIWIKLDILKCRGMKWIMKDLHVLSSLFANTEAGRYTHSKQIKAFHGDKHVSLS